ncbi:DUF3500 domain-containing protein [Terriglobus roseus]|uniref:DUF3500 domain-containing protein n=1 Tax=Terriglobus roseus TaxID=392734 RepID=A0A1G7G3P1_9BACT|nr:DUF3500 domain-containing protein [Terriglobus roseus]SDE82705.1 Protein of unknown function [Terriglobus roseus]
MKRLFVLATAAALSLSSFVYAQANRSTEAVVQAADSFLATLTADQKQKVVYAFDDAAQRARWSNFPTGVVARGGINLKSMSAAQQQAAMKLMSTVLSPMGMEKVNEIRQADDDFKANGSKRGPGGGGRPQGPPPGGQGGPPPQFGGGRGPGGPGGRPPSGDLFGSDLYFISFLGKPSLTQPWMLQFGGHHLALNITIAGSRGVLTPTLTGAQPAMFTLNGKTIRPVGRESDKALALLQALDDSQRKQAVLSYQVADLVLGPGQDGKKIAPEGLKASSMNAQQQAMLLDVVAEWSGILTEPYAAARMAQMKADLKDTYFAWSGATDGKAGTNITAYYRIQGPHLVIEYAPQSDEPGNHVHTMYRDPTNDYGSALLKP